MNDEDQYKQRKIAFYAWEKIGIGTIHMDDLVLSGQAVKEIVDGKVQYRVLERHGCPEMIYKEENNEKLDQNDA
jgi:hypothetical protein